MSRCCATDAISRRATSKAWSRSRWRSSWWAATCPSSIRTSRRQPPTRDPVRARHGRAGLCGECFLHLEARRDPRLRRPHRRRPHGVVRGPRRPSPGHQARSLSTASRFNSAMRAKPWRRASSISPKTGRAKACCSSRTCRVNLSLAALEKFTRGSLHRRSRRGAGARQGDPGFRHPRPAPRSAGRAALRRQPAEAAARQDDAGSSRASSSSTSRRAASISAPRSRSTASSPARRRRARRHRHILRDAGADRPVPPRRS